MIKRRQTIFYFIQLSKGCVNRAGRRAVVGGGSVMFYLTFLMTVLDI